MAHDGPARILQMAGYAADFAYDRRWILPKIKDPSFFHGKATKRRRLGLCLRVVTAEQFFRRVGFDRMRHGQP
jgi:hypothetical protein